MARSWLHLHTLFNNFMILWSYKVHQTSTECFNIFWLFPLRMEKKSQLCPSVLFVATSWGAEMFCPPVLLCQVEWYPPHPEENIAGWRIDLTVAQ